MRIFNIALVALIGLLVAVACAVSQPPSPPATVMSESAAPESADAAGVSRQEVLVNLTDTVIAPRFAAVAAEMDGLREALDALCAGPTADTLATARTAWRDARAPWMRSQAFWFGPVIERRSRSLLDWSPVEPARIETMLADRDAVAAGDVTEFLASTQRGLGAIEYIIFGDGDGADAAVLAGLTPPDGIRCQYLTALGEVAAAEMPVSGMIGRAPMGMAKPTPAILMGRRPVRCWAKPPWMRWCGIRCSSRAALPICGWGRR